MKIISYNEHQKQTQKSVFLMHNKFLQKNIKFFNLEKPGVSSKSMDLIACPDGHLEKLRL